MHLQEGTLVPMASTGLAPDLMGRCFDPAAHPRLSAILGPTTRYASRPTALCPTPFDGLMTVDAEGEKRVHACLGCSLHVDRELVGILTLDALDRC